MRIYNAFLCIRSGPGNSARPGAIWDELADETQVAAIAYAKLLVSNQVWARDCGYWGDGWEGIYPVFLKALLGKLYEFSFYIMDVQSTKRQAVL